MRPTPSARKVLESAGIIWYRDWDAVLFGFVLGVLTTLAMQRVW